MTKKNKLPKQTSKAVIRKGKNMMRKVKSIKEGLLQKKYAVKKKKKNMLKIRQGFI